MRMYSNWAWNWQSSTLQSIRLGVCSWMNHRINSNHFPMWNFNFCSTSLRRNVYWRERTCKCRSDMRNEPLRKKLKAADRRIVSKSKSIRPSLHKILSKSIKVILKLLIYAHSLSRPCPFCVGFKNFCSFPYNEKFHQVCRVRKFYDARESTKEKKTGGLPCLTENPFENSTKYIGSGPL